jgi:hypothetical protein
MWHGAYYPGIQQFDHLLLHHLTHGMTQSSLRLNNGLALLFKWYAVGAKGWTNTLQVTYRVPDHLLVFRQ